MTACYCAAIVLAAGESSRMGADKALLQYQGRSFLEAIVKNIHEAGIEKIVAVLGYHAAEIQRAVLLQGVQVVVNSNYRLGQTSSLQAGLRRSTLPESIACCCRWWIILPYLRRWSGNS